MAEDDEIWRDDDGEVLETVDLSSTPPAASSEWPKPLPVPREPGFPAQPPVLAATPRKRRAASLALSPTAEHFFHDADDDEDEEDEDDEPDAGAAARISDGAAARSSDTAPTAQLPAEAATPGPSTPPPRTRESRASAARSSLAEEEDDDAGATLAGATATTTAASARRRRGSRGARATWPRRAPAELAQRPGERAAGARRRPAAVAPPGAAPIFVNTAFV
ncbi:hypothetical protein JL722_13330 [Aureococcus anophagefferens]|nr:hypothetical protein JL722_13330 [Aureococcus anophagefferens]